MAVLQTCDICGIPGPRWADQRRSPGAVAEPGRNFVLRFGLRRMVTHKQPDGRWTSRANAAGSVDICMECWERVAKPRMMPHKGRRKTA